ncbi:EF hand protein (macronuclear) [Tetrahymena thermophila SB210]|uniref:EF hand protein n=1 Tax=Tetrahymena thermophila (strain SB210) TaxID=312017 RepID=I7MGB7_TETTS|nr:EF hand protein [Tetrahymena thermophila SB210]EAS01312.2 EF hand protein [Tetrahymena thermophila SB210]|eukprot:XP_001021557.2 EF hand protein [Tetrahymena thermophila SB210]
MSNQEQNKILSNSRSPSLKDINALKEDYQLQYLIKSSKAKLKKQILIENNGDDYLTYDQFIQAARKVQFRFALAKHIIKLKNFFMDHNNRIPVQELIDRLVLVEQNKDNIIINFNLAYGFGQNEITKREAELIDKQSSSPPSMIKNKSNIITHSPSGNLLVHGNLSKSPSKNMLLIQQREQYSGDKLPLQGSINQNRSKFISGGGGVKRIIAKTGNNTPEEKIFNACVEKEISFGLLTELEKKGVDMRCIQQLIGEHMKLDTKATGFVDQQMLEKEILTKQFWNTRQKQELIKIIDDASVKGLVSFVKINHFALAFSKLPQAYKQMNLMQNHRKQKSFQKFRSEFTAIQQYLNIIRQSIRKGQFQSHTSAFIFFDSNCDSYITFEEFLQGCQILTIDLTDDQIYEAFDFLDKEKKGYLCEEEFKNFYYNLHEFQLNVPIIVPVKSKQNSPINNKNQYKAYVRHRAPSLNGNQLMQVEPEYDLNPVQSVRRASLTSKYHYNFSNKKSSEDRQSFFRSDSLEEFQKNRQKQEQDQIVNKYRQKINNILNQSKKLRSVSANKTAIMRQQYITKIYQQGNQDQLYNQYNLKPQRRIHTDQDEFQYYENENDYNNQQVQYQNTEKVKNSVKFSPHLHSQTQPYQLNDESEINANFENITVPAKLNNSLGITKPSLNQSQIHKQDLKQKYSNQSQYDSNEFLDQVDSMREIINSNKQHKTINF